MVPLTLEVPPDVSEALSLPEHEARPRLLLELALGLYAQNLLPIGKAARLAGMNQHLFSQQLGIRGIPRHYGPEELSEDLAHAGLQ